LSGAEIAALVGARAISAVEVTRAALARLEAVNPAVNAVVQSRPEAALAAAGLVDAAIARGEAPGRLAGVPVTVKVNTDMAGYATTNGVTLQRDLVAREDSPVASALAAAGAIVIGRTNTPAFSYRWFTANRLHGATKNPRDPRLTPGGSSGGAAAAVAAGIGAIGHGTDIAGSIRYPAYACGIHGLRPSLGRVAAFNASSPERGIGPQLMAVSGPIARTIGDLRLGLEAMAAPDPRDPWCVPAPLAGPAAPRRAVLVARPDGMAIAPAVRDALVDAAGRLERAGWVVEEIPDLPGLEEAVSIQIVLWLGDGYDEKLRDAEREGDPGALNVLRSLGPRARGIDLAGFAGALTRRATLTRRWRRFLRDTPVLLLPVSGELPFEDGLDLLDFERVWRAQTPQIGLPVLGLPALTVSTGLVGGVPVGVQIVADWFREDLCLEAGEAIAAAGVPPAPIDP
jgi:amidase